MYVNYLTIKITYDVINEISSLGIPEEKLLTSVENIASTIAQTKFIGSDKTSDSIVLMKTLQVLYCLIMAPEGEYLPNESVCEIMMRCFRFCFEIRLAGKYLINLLLILNKIAL